MARQGAAQVGQRAAARLGAGQRVLGAERAVEGREGRRRRGRGDLPHRDQRRARAGGARGADHPRRRRRPCSRRSAIPTRDGPTPTALDAELRGAVARSPRDGAAGAVRQDHRRRAGGAGGALRRCGSAVARPRYQLPPPPPAAASTDRPAPATPPLPLDDGAVDADAVELDEDRRHVDVAEAGVLRDRGRPGDGALPPVDLVEGDRPRGVLPQHAALGRLLGVERLRLVEEPAERLDAQPQPGAVRRAHPELPAAQQRREPAAAEQRADDDDDQPALAPPAAPRTRRRTRRRRRRPSPARRGHGCRSCAGRPAGPTARS